MCLFMRDIYTHYLYHSTIKIPLHNMDAAPQKQDDQHARRSREEQTPIIIPPETHHKHKTR